MSSTRHTHMITTTDMIMVMDTVIATEVTDMDTATVTVMEKKI